MKRDSQVSDARSLLESGCLADERGDHDEAMSLYQASARLGNAEAMLNLGNLLSAKGGSSDDVQKAKALYRKAFKRGCMYAATSLGAQYVLEGKPGLARRWYQVAAERGEEWASEALMNF